MVFGEYTAGAEDDLNKATQLARRMVTHWGMSDRLGPSGISRRRRQSVPRSRMAEPRRFSEHTAQVIDEEVSRLLRDAADRAAVTLDQQRAKLDLLAHKLEEIETLDEEDIESLIGPPANKKVEKKAGERDT